MYASKQLQQDTRAARTSFQSHPVGPFLETPDRWTWAFSLLGFSISPIPMAPPNCVSVPSLKRLQSTGTRILPISLSLAGSHSSLQYKTMPFLSYVGCHHFLHTRCLAPHLPFPQKHSQMTNLCKSLLISPTILSCYTQTLLPYSVKHPRIWPTLLSLLPFYPFFPKLCIV